MRLFCLLLAFYFTSFAIGQDTRDFDAAIAAFEAGDFDTAQLLFEKSRSQDELEAASCYYLGRISMHEGEYASSINQFEKAVALAPAEADYHYWLSNAYFSQIDRVGALKKARLAKKGKASSERSLELDPEHADAMSNLIQFYIQAPRIAGGDVDKGEEMAKRLLALDVRQGRMMLASVYTRKDQHDRAREQYVVLMDEYAEDVYVYYTAGLYFQTRGEFDDAFSVFEKATAIDAEWGNAYYQIGRTAVFAEKELERGMKALQYYLTLDVDMLDMPSHASAWWRIGMLHELGGNPSEARSAYESALALDAQHEEAKKALKELG